MKSRKRGKTLMEVFAEEENTGEVARDLAQEMNIKAKEDSDRRSAGVATKRPTVERDLGKKA